MEVAETATKILIPDLSELAVSIVAELIDVRHIENYSDAARAARKPFGLSVLSKAKKTTTPRTCEYAGRFLCGDKVALQELRFESER